MYWGRILIATCLLAITTACFAIEDATKIDLNSALELAVKNNLGLKGSRLNIDIYKNNIKIMGRFQNPSVDSFFNYGDAGEGNPQQIGVSQVLELGKRGIRKKLAKTELEIVKEGYEFDVFNLKMDVRKAYVDLVAKKTILNVLKEEQKLLEELLHIAKKRVEVGASAEIDVLQAEIALNRITTDVNSATADVKAAFFNFNKTLNLKDSEAFYETKDDLLLENKTFVSLLTPSSKETVPSFQSIRDLALEKRFDLKIAKQDVKRTEDNLTLVKRQRIPDVALAGGYLYQGSDAANNYSHQSGGFAGASLTNIPLFYNYSPEIKNAKIQKEQAELLYDSTMNHAVNDLNRTYEKFVNAKLNLNYYDENLMDKSNELIRISKLSYEVGKANLTSLIVMEQSYQAIKTGYINALADYYNCWVDFLIEVNDEEFKLNGEEI